jgi:hypothetical protein
MHTVKIDPPTVPMDEAESAVPDLEISGGITPDCIAPHRATITSATWAPASDTVTALLAAMLTAPR